MTTPYTPRPLPAPSAALPATREAAHRLAVHLLAPAARRVTGRTGLRRMPGGLGPPGDAAEPLRPSPVAAGPGAA
jgi:hypothetical protein